MIAIHVKPLMTTSTLTRTNDRAISKAAWSAPTMVDQRSAFEVTAYQKVMTPKASP